MKNNQQGFTLIELMIVVAIIAILAAIAIPQYQNYIARSQMSRAVGEAGALKTAVEDCMANNADLATECPNAQGDTIDTAFAAFVPFVDGGDGSGEMTYTLSENASPKVRGAVITWSRDAEGVWTCDAGGNEFAPKSCSGAAAAPAP